jgi:hypothetical protein
MINPKELRIGNYVKGKYIDLSDNEPVEVITKIIGIDSVGFSEYSVWVEDRNNNKTESYENLEPITLTEEILLRLGFNGDRYSCEYIYTDVIIYGEFTKENISVSVNPVTGKYSFLWMNYNLLRMDVLYVHQLQNIFYSLTGKELTFKE